MRTRNLVLTARLVDAREAQAIRLVDEVLPADRLAARVSELARHVATLAPLTLAAIKEGARRVSQAFALRDAEDLLLSCYLSRDFQEGVRAFLDKRPARWEGR